MAHEFLLLYFLLAKLSNEKIKSNKRNAIEAVDFNGIIFCGSFR